MRRESAFARKRRGAGSRGRRPVFHPYGVHFENELPVQIEDRCVNPRWSPTSRTRGFLPCNPGLSARSNVQ